MLQLDPASFHLHRIPIPTIHHIFDSCTLLSPHLSFLFAPPLDFLIVLDCLPHSVQLIHSPSLVTTMLPPLNEITYCTISLHLRTLLSISAAKVATLKKKSHPLTLHPVICRVSSSGTPAKLMTICEGSQWWLRSTTQHTFFVFLNLLTHYSAI